MGQAEAIITSPPYADTAQPFDGDKPEAVLRAWWERYRQAGGGYGYAKFAESVRNGRRTAMGAYGTSDGQVGALKSGPCPGGEAGVGDVGTLTWGGCYKDSWKGLIVPEAFAHPAKVARGLAVRLFDHGFARGWWKKSDLVADPFCGICGFGIIAAYKGLRFVGVEIEERFHSLCLENVALHRRRWEAGGDPPPVCLLGDSREFAKLVGGVTRLLALWEIHRAGGGVERLGDFGAWVRSVLADADAGAGAALVAGAAACVTSPPYADAHVAEIPRGKAGCASGGIGTQYRLGNRGPNGLKKADGTIADNYGTTPGQLGALPQGDADSVLTSPPYAASVHGRNGIDLCKCDRPGAPAWVWAQGYGASPGNVGGLAAGDAAGVVTSPPYEASLDPRPGGSPGIDWRKAKEGGRCRTPARQAAGHGYGAGGGQVGALCAETYWSAMKIIWEQSFLALRPSGVLCCVIKDFVRAKKRVPLCDQTWRLLLSLGFLPVERIRCLLSEETREPSLFGGEEVRRKSRESFFRRLSRKRGAPEIPYEEILVVRRPPAGVP